MSDKELASSASSNNHSSERQHPLSDEEKATKTSPEGEEQEGEKEDRRQLTGIKVHSGLDLASAMPNPFIDRI